MNRRALAVLVEFACRAAAGLVLATPVTAVIAASGIGAFPAGDRLLFEPGGLFLVEVARSAWPSIAPFAGSSLVTLVLVTCALTLPRALLWTVSAEVSSEPLTASFGRAGSLVPPLLTLTGLGFLGQTLAWMLGLTLAGILRAKSENPMTGDLFGLAVVASAGVVVLALGVLRDLASAALASGAANARSALRAGLASVLGSPGAALGRWLLPAAAGLALVVAVAGAVGAIDVARPGALRLALVLLLHQAVVLWLSCCRAVWFGAAVALVRPQLGTGSVARR